MYMLTSFSLKSLISLGRFLSNISFKNVGLFFLTAAINRVSPSCVFAQRSSIEHPFTFSELLLTRSNKTTSEAPVYTSCT